MTTKLKGVMIKGMEMPENCKKCPNIRTTGTVLEDIPFCKVTGLVITFSEERAKLNNRPSWCPLQEVK